MRWACVVCLLAPQLAAQAAMDAVRAFVADVRQPGDERCRKLALLQEHAALDLATALAALRDADEALRRTAAAIVRHEWAELPPELLQGLDESPAAARAVLEELAIAPRPAAADWAARRTQPADGRTNDERCLALAAQGRPFAAADVDLLLHTLLSGQAGDGFLAAAAVTPADVADAMLGRLHAGLLQGQVDLVQVGPLLDRLSNAGCKRLLGLVVTLPGPAAATICQRVAALDASLVRARARAMLDGETPLEALWFAYAGPLLDRPERRERALRLLADEQADARSRQGAFDALLQAKVVDERMIDFATADGADIALLQRLLDAAVDELPGPRLVEWLAADARRSTATVKALARRAVLGEHVERALLGVLAGQGQPDGVFFEAAAMALVQRGSQDALERLWPSLRGAKGWSDYVDALGRRREPFVHELLLTELASKAADPAAKALDDVRLALVAFGDRRQLAELAARAKASPAGFVRRCRHFADPLPAPLALALLDDLPRVADDDVAVEMTAWAATSTDAAVLARLQQVWSADSGAGRGDDSRVFELQEVALRALATGPQRTELVAELRRAIAGGPLPERLGSLAYELAATTAQPPSAADLRLLAELVLLPPLGDPERETRAAQRWANGRFGFPMMAAVAQRLRGGDPAAVAAAFGEVAGEVLRDSRHTRISRQRLRVLWGNLEADRGVLAAVGIATAPLMLALPEAAEVGVGPAHWFLQQDAERRADFAVARAHAQKALGAMLRLPEERRTARIFLGERDPGAGRDPWAALAAAPHRLAFSRAKAAGNDAEAEVAATLVREFAGRDVQSLVSLPSSKPKESVR
ncbi:MAG TPA: hypothetical protein VF384_14115 [Planctomycetota bacterium]